MELDDEWKHFLINSNLDNIKSEDNSKEIKNEEDFSLNIREQNNINIPEASELYISTKTKIIYLNITIDIYNIFWKIKVNDYDLQEEGIIKKQVKISSTNKEDLNKIIDLANKEKNVYTNIINHIDNPSGRIKFKDIRKLSIGISKKDLLYTRSKDKSAFYNCFVVTLRIKQNDCFKEFHVKIFNTGKLEIPGIQKDESLYIIIDKIITILHNITNENIYYLKDKTENVLINSNFNCGFYINREKLFNILRYEYNINTNFDSCSYPGIQCIYYHTNNETNNEINNETNNETNNEINNLYQENNIKISFMIFRTGSILIVGKCNEDVLNIVYNFIKNILKNEYSNIAIKNIEYNNQPKINKQAKLKKKYILLNS